MRGGGRKARASGACGEWAGRPKAKPVRVLQGSGRLPGGGDRVALKGIGGRRTRRKTVWRVGNNINLRGKNQVDTSPRLNKSQPVWRGGHLSGCFRDPLVCPQSAPAVCPCLAPSRAFWSASWWEKLGGNKGKRNGEHC